MLALRDPFRELTDLSETFDRFFDRFFDRVWNGMQWTDTVIPIDLTETDDAYLVKASLPGINPDDLDITYSNNVLTIRGEVKPDQTSESSRYHLRERWSGPFRRSLVLPTKVVAENIQANYEAGVLTLYLPKSEEVKPKRIPIHAGASTKMIEGKVAEKV